VDISTAGRLLITKAAATVRNEPMVSPKLPTNSGGVTAVSGSTNDSAGAASGTLAALDSLTMGRTSNPHRRDSCPSSRPTTTKGEPTAEPWRAGRERLLTYCFVEVIELLYGGALRGVK
jgi:hypothetical protein